MSKSSRFARAAAVVSSVALAGGYVVYTGCQSSKPAANVAPSTQPEQRRMVPGSKSAAITLTPPIPKDPPPAAPPETMGSSGSRQTELTTPVDLRITAEESEELAPPTVGRPMMSGSKFGAVVLPNPLRLDPEVPAASDPSPPSPLAIQPHVPQSPQWPLVIPADQPKDRSLAIGLMVATTQPATQPTTQPAK